MELMDSLSPTVEGDDDRLIDEIEARIERAMSGATGSRWEEVRERLESRSGKKLLDASRRFARLF